MTTPFSTTVRNRIHTLQATVRSVLRVALIALILSAGYAVSNTNAHADDGPFPDNIPHLVLGTESVTIAFNKDEKYPPTLSEGIAFMNDGAGELRWQLYVGSDYGGCAVPSPRKWIAISPSSGSLDPKQGTKAAASVQTNELSVGTHSATICLATNDPGNPLVAIPLTIIVKGAD